MRKVVKTDGIAVSSVSIDVHTIVRVSKSNMCLLHVLDEKVRWTDLFSLSGCDSTHDTVEEALNLSLSDDYELLCFDSTTEFKKALTGKTPEFQKILKKFWGV